FGGGSVFRCKGGEQGFEGAGIFAGDDDAAGSESVFQGIAAGDGFAFDATGSGGTGSLLNRRLAEVRGLIRRLGRGDWLLRRGEGGACMHASRSGPEGA